MKIISLNCNGLRSIITKEKNGTKHKLVISNNTLVQLIYEKQPDIICLQEVRCAENIDIKMLINWKILGYDYIFQNCADKKGYSGTTIISKIKPINIINNYGKFNEDDEFNLEGRIITIELDTYFIVNVYTPNSKPDLSRLKYRTEKWDNLFSKYINFLQKNKPVIICGDLNVAHKEIDLANPKANKKKHGFTIEERNTFDKLLMECKLIDIYRFLYPQKIKYSWWSNFANSRLRMVGWRIDYFLISKKLQSKIKETDILNDFWGSDHCPIYLEIIN